MSTVPSTGVRSVEPEDARSVEGAWTISAASELRVAGGAKRAAPAADFDDGPGWHTDEWVARAWRVLADIPDPELPAISICELGVVRDVLAIAQGLEVVLTPTYSGCPASEVIGQSVIAALAAAGLSPVTVTQRRAPAWTTDWISEAGRRKLLSCGIVPPARGAAPRGDATAGPDAACGTVAPLRFMPRPAALRLACVRCGSTDTEQLAAFGSTACKALHRCRACGEPFEHFKPI